MTESHRAGLIEAKLHKVLASIESSGSGIAFVIMYAGEKGVVNAVVGDNEEVAALLELATASIELTRAEGELVHVFGKAA
jgi:hypothetical protein